MWRRIGAGDSSHFASGASVPYQDPFTGTNRYVPGSGADAPISKRLIFVLINFFNLIWFFSRETQPNSPIAR